MEIIVLTMCLIWPEWWTRRLRYSASWDSQTEMPGFWLMGCGTCFESVTQIGRCSSHRQNKQVQKSRDVGSGSSNYCT